MVYNISLYLESTVIAMLFLWVYSSNSFAIYNAMSIMSIKKGTAVVPHQLVING